MAEKGGGIFAQPALALKNRYTTLAGRTVARRGIASIQEEQRGGAGRKREKGKERKDLLESKTEEVKKEKREKHFYTHTDAGKHTPSSRRAERRCAY